VLLPATQETINGFGGVKYSPAKPPMNLEQNNWKFSNRKDTDTNQKLIGRRAVILTTEGEQPALQVQSVTKQQSLTNSQLQPHQQ